MFPNAIKIEDTLTVTAVEAAYAGVMRLFPNDQAAVTQESGVLQRHYVGYPLQRLHYVNVVVFNSAYVERNGIVLQADILGAPGNEHMVIHSHTQSQRHGPLMFLAPQGVPCPYGIVWHVRGVGSLRDGDIVRTLAYLSRTGGYNA